MVIAMRLSGHAALPGRLGWGNVDDLRIQVHTELQVRRNTTGQKPNDTDKTALELIEELAKVCSDQAIAALLNRLGYKTGAGKTWRGHSVHNARYIHRLTNYRRRNEWVTIQQAHASAW